MSKYPTKNRKLIVWVNQMANLCQPDEIVWIDGSAKEATGK